MPRMNLDAAQDECLRWLDYLKRQEEKSLRLQALARDRRSGQCSDEDTPRRLAEINGPGVTVYDGANLAEAVRTLLAHILRTTPPTP
jgi:hypothetical protein